MRGRHRSQVVATVGACLLASSVASGQTWRVSIASDGTQANGASGSAPGSFESHGAISGDGRFVVFTSSATNLTSEGVPGTFLHDRTGGQTSLIAPGPMSGDRGISHDGRYVLFPTASGSWVVLDRRTNSQQVVPAVGGGGGLAARVTAPVLSGNGRAVAYLSDADVSQAGFAPHYSLYVYDLDSGKSCSAHRSTLGVQGNDRLVAPLGLNWDGRIVGYTSLATNLVGGDADYNVFVHDCRTGETRPVGDSSSQAFDGGYGGFLSYDGRFVAWSQGAIVGRMNIFDRAGSATWTTSSVLTNYIRSQALSGNGRFSLHYSRPSLLSVAQSNAVVFDRLLETVAVASLANAGASGNGASTPDGLSADGRFVLFTSDASNLVSGDTNGVADLFVRDMFDGDRDAMDDRWEDFFGFDRTSAADAAQDADGDGTTNVQEAAAGTHPRGLTSATRYFAEGANGTFFSTRIALANPSAAATAHALLRLERSDGTFGTQLVDIPPLHSRHISATEVLGLASAEFSGVVESDVPIVADRLMQWDVEQAYGSHAEAAVIAPASTWYFAEGSTNAGFALFYLLHNPGSTPSSVDARFLRPTGAPEVVRYLVPARSRLTVWANRVPGLAATDVAAEFRVSVGPSVIAERAMYLSRPGELFSAGHGSAGVTSPMLEWTMAEGATGPFFDVFVLLANPNSTPAQVEATFALPTGVTYRKSYTVPGNGRVTLWLDEELIGGTKPLSATPVATTIRSVNGVPIVAERAMWWPGDASTWYEAHSAAGSSTLSTRWAVADASVGTAAENAYTYLLLANRSPTAGEIRVTLLYADIGTPVSRTFTILPGGRLDISLRDQFPEALARNQGVLVESIGPSPVEFSLERSTYRDANGHRWGAGSSSLATALP